MSCLGFPEMAILVLPLRAVQGFLFCIDIGPECAVLLCWGFGLKGLAMQETKSRQLTIEDDTNVKVSGQTVVSDAVVAS